MNNSRLKGFLMIEVVSVLLIVVLLGISFNKLVISFTNWSYNFHYQSKAVCLAENYFEIINLSTDKIDKQSLLDNFKKDIFYYLPKGQAEFTSNNLKLSWFFLKKRALIIKQKK